MDTFAVIFPAAGRSVRKEYDSPTESTEEGMEKKLIDGVAWLYIHLLHF